MAMRSGGSALSGGRCDSCGRSCIWCGGFCDRCGRRGVRRSDDGSGPRGNSRGDGRSQHDDFRDATAVRHCRPAGEVDLGGRQMELRGGDWSTNCWLRDVDNGAAEVLSGTTTWCYSVTTTMKSCQRRWFADQGRKTAAWMEGSCSPVLMGQQRRIPVLHPDIKAQTEDENASDKVDVSKLSLLLL